MVVLAVQDYDLVAFVTLEMWLCVTVMPNRRQQ
jgi:hypothetical protein